jgi:hypothetical protein
MTVPFAPGTQYMICMVGSQHALLASYPNDVDTPQQVASNDVWGGCQALYTMYPSQTSGCSNITLPTGYLGVDAIVQDGPISRYGWVPQVRGPDREPLTLPLTCVSVHGHFLDPHEWDPAVHHVYRPFSPSSKQIRLVRYESHKLDRFLLLVDRVFYQSD